MQKVLWLTSMPLNSITRDFGYEESVYGGWLEGISNQLIQSGEVNLFYLFISNTNRFLVKDTISTHFIDFGLKDRKANFMKLQNYLCSEQLDIVHLFGTENKDLNWLYSTIDVDCKVVSIQGLLSEYYKDYDYKLYDYLNEFSLIRRLPFIMLVKLNKWLFWYRSLSERMVLRQTKNVIGRTDWDYQSSGRFSRNRSYFKCNETLRNEFYCSPKWSIEKKKLYRLFVSQGNYPIKGLHFLIKVISRLKYDYPDIELIVSGENILKNKTIFHRLGISYSNLVQNMIRRYRLEDSVFFIGPQKSFEISHYLLTSHLAILPSTIENSPNSLGEAMLLGVPTIAAEVGGIPSIIKKNQDCFTFISGDDHDLESKIRYLFEHNDQLSELSKFSVDNASEIYDPMKNVNELITIYRSIR